jgi:polar amino acid transport system substrate-binding protein
MCRQRGTQHEKEVAVNDTSKRRDFLKLGMAGLATAGVMSAATAVDVQKAAAQAAPDSLLRTVLDRGKLIVGTGSTNAPWHFENDAGELVGMDITMGRILAKGLFDDPTSVEFVMQDPAQRIPNVTTNKVDITIQFMTMTAQRSQLINFSRPYYVEGVALLTLPTAENKTFDKLLAGGSATRISILQNVDAEANVHLVLPESQVMQIDTQANVLQALESKRVDAAAVDLSTVRWLASRNPDKYFDAGKSWFSMLYGAALRQGDPDWLTFVNTTFTTAMFGHETALYDAAFKDYFGQEPPARHPGFPVI